MTAKTAIRRFTWVCVAMLVLVVSARRSEARIVAPSDAGDRSTLLGLLGEICKDFDFVATQNAAGEWVVQKEPKGTHTTPVGCDLICRLIDADCTVTLGIDPGVVGGSTVPKDPDNAQNGTGSDSTVDVNPGTDIYYFDSAGNKHKAAPAAVLAHELCHAEDMWLGLDSDDTAEKHAIELWENPVHRERGETERQGHGGTTSPC